MDDFRRTPHQNWQGKIDCSEHKITLSPEYYKVDL